MIRIMLVEDHASFRQALAAVLELQDDMRVAAQLGGGEAAAVIAAAAEVDVAVVDLELPGGDGVGVVQALRDAERPVPSLVLTGMREDSQLGRAVEAGAAAVMTKSAEMSEIIDAIRAVAGGGSVLPADVTSRRLQALARDRERRWRGRLLAEQLTARELEVLEHLVYGESTTQVAAGLGISPDTAQTHVRNLMAKLGASSRLEAVSTALQLGLVDPP